VIGPFDLGGRGGKFGNTLIGVVPDNTPLPVGALFSGAPTTLVGT